MVGLCRLSRPRPREDRDRSDNVERTNVDDEDKERNKEKKYRQNHLFQLSSYRRVKSPPLEKLVHLHRVHHTEAESEQ